VLLCCLQDHFSLSNRSEGDEAYTDDDMEDEQLQDGYSMAAAHKKPARKLDKKQQVGSAPSSSGSISRPDGLMPYSSNCCCCSSMESGTRRQVMM